MVRLVADVWHVGLPHQVAVARRLRVDVHDADGVALWMSPRADEREVRERLLSPDDGQPISCDAY